MIVKSHRWQKTAMAVASATVFCLWASPAAALSLGRIAVQSTLGEPLRAEIDILDINSEEASSLKTSVALPEAFRAAGLEYNPALTSLQIVLQKRSDGRAYLQLSSERAVSDAFVDLILEARWASGRIVRDYTLLLAPAPQRQPQAVTPIAAQLSPEPAMPTPAPPAVASAGSADTAPPAPAVVQATAAAPVAAPASAPTSKRVTVKSGDTAGKLAAAHQPAGVSLDQMLIALLRANPDAFMGGNINRIKAGAVLTLPGDEQAQATSAHQAQLMVVAQSKDFNEFRRKLASSAPATPIAPSERKASGPVQASVQDKKPAAASTDKLTLSKGIAHDKTGEDKIAAERDAKEAAKRTAELSKNIAELNKLGAESALPAASSPADSAAQPQEAASAPLTPAPAVAVAAPPPPASAAAKPPLEAASAPLAAAPLLDTLLSQPLLPAAAAGLVALLAGLAFYRIRQRNKTAPLDALSSENHSFPDALLVAGHGGQLIDTTPGDDANASAVESVSPPAAAEVDPIAEADVYLAYGREQQAEEILKEALQTQPERVAIPLKLLEIYAQRNDPENFEDMARAVKQLTDEQSPDWRHVCELGITLDPTNALYQSAGTLASDNENISPADVVSPPALPAQAADRVVALSPTDLSLDLNFSLDAAPDEPPAEAEQENAAPPPGLDLNFDFLADSVPAENRRPEAPDRLASDPALDETEEESFSAAPHSTPPSAGAPSFDLSTVSLDLDTPAEPAEPAAAADPMATKLALAEEFTAIGDTEGARALLEEVVAEATDDTKLKAQNALSQLS